MITYSVAQVEALTGIKAHTLRVWERRYDFLNPDRTDTNIRYYSDEQLKKLLNFGILVKHGYRISKLGSMSSYEIEEAVASVMTDPEVALKDEIKGLTIAMLEMDEAGFDLIFERQVMKSGFLNAVVDIIYPFLQYVGVLWSTNKAMVAQEHFISNLIRQKLLSAIERLSLPAHDAPVIVLFLFEGEDHELGLLVANYIAKEMGWRVLYLGQDVPVINLKKVVDLSDPKCIMTMLVTPKTSRIGGLVRDLSEDLKIPFLISGSKENLELVSPANEGVRLIGAPREFVGFLRELII